MNPESRKEVDLSHQWGLDNYQLILTEYTWKYLQMESVTPDTHREQLTIKLLVGDPLIYRSSQQGHEPGLTQVRGAHD